MGVTVVFGVAVVVPVTVLMRAFGGPREAKRQKQMSMRSAVLVTVLDPSVAMALDRGAHVDAG